MHCNGRSKYMYEQYNFQINQVRSSTSSGCFDSLPHSGISLAIYTHLFRESALNPRQHDSVVNSLMVEDYNLIRVDHVDEEELVAFCLKEGKHFGVRQSGNGKIEAPS